MSDNECRDATFGDLKMLIESLNANGVDYLLVGGYALLAHGYNRATTDIDVLVRGTKESGELVRRALLVLPDKAAADIDPEWFEEGGNIRVADEFLVDVMLNANGQTFESLSKFAQVVDWNGVQVRTVNLEGLLLTKQTSREKDVQDRIVLERAIDAYRRQQAVLRPEAGVPGLGGSILRPTPATHAEPTAEPKSLFRRLFKR